ncbi:MAG TPA: hypothetical protein VFJ62_19965 [Usitatibacter sp.]|nr:hypothetical protein [Usitatibacter sp.]
MRTACWIAALMASVATVAQAVDGTDVAQAVRWRCWYTAQPDNPGIACRLAEPAQAVAPQPLDPQSAALVLPRIVQQIHTDPESLRDTVVVIPLHSPPIDMRMVMRLAAGVMCGRRVGCTVELAAELPGG